MHLILGNAYDLDRNQSIGTVSSYDVSTAFETEMKSVLMSSILYYENVDNGNWRLAEVVHLGFGAAICEGSGCIPKEVKQQHIIGTQKGFKAGQRNGEEKEDHSPKLLPCQELIHDRPRRPAGARG